MDEYNYVWMYSTSFRIRVCKKLRKPIRRNASIIARSMCINIFINVLLIVFIVQLQEYFNILNATPTKQGTVIFSLFAFSALFNTLNCRELD
ncbi:cation transporting ATPase C-terminal domain-containing protein [Terrisporobacter petrolearius]|uniref:cation transporting ATPase C-terminal domain-containing protein n=1 Tax=Terrisporobacter petrolearius TaxID=1460447 RepID=UPI002241018C|nr:cation transporting ATPase C-terminal domain-containing protein [Terrisporobacter petrolearius]